MCQLAAIVAALLTSTAARPQPADDVTSILLTGVWYADAGGVMKTRYEYTFRKDGTFRVEVLNDVANPPASGTWKVANENGTSRLVLATKDDRAHLLPAESEVRHDKAKNVLVVRGKDDKEVVLKHRKGR